MVSRITLLGNLGKDPEMRYSKDGNAFTNFSLATKHGFGSKSKTSWWNVTSFGKTAEAVNQYATKGSLLYVEGDCVDEEIYQQGRRDGKDQEGPCQHSTIRWPEEREFC